VKWRFGLIQLRSVHIPWAKKGICPGAISRAPAKHSYLINQITMWSHPCGPAAKILTENDGELANRLTGRGRKTGRRGIRETDGWSADIR
jgi:hypothetical protein